MQQTSQESLYLQKEEYTGRGHVLTDYEEICCIGAFAIWQYEREKTGAVAYGQISYGSCFLCYGDEENARIYAVHLTTANQSEIRRAYLVSVIGNFIPIT